MERSDVISRSKLIEEIEKEIDGVIVKDTYSKGKNAGLRKAKILVEEKPGQYYGGGWIACEDRLPDKEVLCCDKYGEMILGYIAKNKENETGFHAEKERRKSKERPKICIPV